MDREAWRATVYGVAKSTVDGVLADPAEIICLEAFVPFSKKSIVINSII